MAKTSPAKERGQERSKARSKSIATLQSLDGQTVTASNQRDVLTALLQILGYADQDGKIKTS
jgi:hypothetical protein